MTTWFSILDLNWDEKAVEKLNAFCHGKTIATVTYVDHEIMIIFTDGSRLDIQGQEDNEGYKDPLEVSCGEEEEEGEE